MNTTASLLVVSLATAAAAPTAPAPFLSLVIGSYCHHDESYDAA